MSDISSDRPTPTNRDVSSDSAPTSESSSKRAVRSRTVTAVACRACQRRKTKCDGQRPACSACRGRTGVCVYEVQDGLSRVADLKQKNQLLSTRVLELEQLINRLRSVDDMQASTALARLRLGDEISAIVRETPGRRSDWKVATSRSGFDNGGTGRDIPEELMQPSFSEPNDGVASEYQPRAWQMDAHKVWDDMMPGSATPNDAAARGWQSPIWEERDEQFADGAGSRNAMQSNRDGSPMTGRDGVAFAGSQPSRRGSRQQQWQPREKSTRVDGGDTPSSRATRQDGSFAFASRQSVGVKHLAVASTLRRFDHPGGQAVDGAKLQSGPNVLDHQGPRLPMWAVLPLHASFNNSMNKHFETYLSERRARLKNGAPPTSIMGSRPVLDALYDEQVFEHADDLSKWSAKLAFAYPARGVEQAIFFWAAWYLMRWLILPTPETYDGLPDWLRPTPHQLCVAHSICCDFVVWPRLRDLVVRRRMMQEDATWLVELSRTTRCSWPHSLDDGLCRDGGTGLLNLNPLLIDCVRNFDKWSIGTRFRNAWPDMENFFAVRSDENG